MLNSRLDLFTAAPSRSPCKMVHANGAPLLPKLRGHFAEFLNPSYLERLRLLASPTCVGLRYGHDTLNLEAFLGRRYHPVGSPEGSFPDSSRVKGPRICLRPTLQVSPHVRQCVGLLASVPPSRAHRGAGIFTCFPSPTPFGLGLGTGSPWDD